MLLVLSSGIALGLAAGLAPGPLSALVISQTLSHGVREGMKVAAAPLITDLPIILLAIVVGREIAAAPMPLGLLSMAGAAYICYLGWASLNIGAGDHKPPEAGANSIFKGILTNLLNPHPYLFWITVGTPLLMKTWADGPWGALLWLVSFYVMLVGSKIGLSVSAGYFRRRLYGRGYLWLNRILGLVLFGFAGLLARDGMALLGIWGRL